MTNIASESFLKRIEARERQFGEMIGVSHGEGFMVRQVVPVEDPIAAFADSDREWNGFLGLLS